MKVWRCVALVALATLVAGCEDDFDGCVSPIGTDQVSSDAPSSGGPGGVPVIVTVISGLDGAPISGAPVVVLWARDHIEKPTNETFDMLPSAPPLVWMGLRTDANGKAFANVPRDRYYLLSAAGPGMTEETSRVYAPDPVSEPNLVIRLYPLVLDFNVTGTFASPTLPLVLGAANQDWQPIEIPIASDQETSDNIWGRAAKSSVAMRWSVPAGRLVDLGLGVGVAPTSMDFNQNTDMEGPAGGEFHEQIDDVQDPESLFGTFDYPMTLYVGPYIAGSTHIDPLGTIEWTANLHLELASREFNLDDCGPILPESKVAEFQDRESPGLAVWGVLGVLGAALFVSRRF